MQPHARSKPWQVLLALTLVYLCWGTTYLAIHAGVATLPPGLFGGVRVGMAGACLLIYLACGGGTLWLTRADLAWAAVTGSLLFIGGNGLLTLAETTIPSGVASVLVATTPLWMALLESAWSGGERLTGRGWLGLLLGLVGVSLLFHDRLAQSGDFLADRGPWLCMGSALAWSVGSFIQRRRARAADHLAIAAWQMFLGGIGQALLGVLWGEVGSLTPEAFTPGAIYAFFHLLIFGSLVGFVAFGWLLHHVPASLAGTYAYVNPVVALLVGWIFAGEALTGTVLFGMAVILIGVALVRSGVAHATKSLNRPRPTLSLHKSNLPCDEQPVEV